MKSKLLQESRLGRCLIHVSDAFVWPTHLGSLTNHKNEHASVSCMLIWSCNTNEIPNRHRYTAADYEHAALAKLVREIYDGYERYQAKDIDWNRHVIDMNRSVATLD